MNRDTARKCLFLLLFGALTVAMTWPQARLLSTHVHDSDDSLLSIWRISWIAHILPEQPTDLLNGNIFHPEKRTLAYTDSVLLQGLAAAPFIWAGFSPVAVYNALVLVSIALSGWAMWLYAARITGSPPAGMLAGIIYAFVPFRFDHFNHLELHATFFLPLTLLALDRFFESRSRRDAALMMVAFVGQVYSGIYYAVFLATVLMVVVPIKLFRIDYGARRDLLRAAVPAVLVAMLVVAPYLLAYVANRATLGERQDADIAMYSAAWWNYFATPAGNVVHGEWSASLGENERRLFPGVIAIGLALVGALGRGRYRITLLTAGLVGLIISFGFNTPLYDVLRAIVVPYRGLRVPARASILVFMAIAGLAAFGYARLTRRRSGVLVSLGAAVLGAAMLVEYRTELDSWLHLPARPPQVYQWLADQPRAVIAEVPLARADRLDIIPDGLYMYNSTVHWHPIVNGYSGFFPRSFIELSEVTRDFPDEASIAYLKQRGVDLIVVHGGLLGADRFGQVTAALLARPDVTAMAQFDEPRGTDMVFRLQR